MKIVVLDDDPTGVQTVHDVPVYTDWKMDSLQQAFSEESNMFFDFDELPEFLKMKRPNTYTKRSPSGCIRYHRIAEKSSF